MGLLANLKYYDLNEKIKSFSIMYVGWRCEGNIPIKYYNNKYYNSNLPAITKKKEMLKVIKLIGVQ